MDLDLSLEKPDVEALLAIATPAIPGLVARDVEVLTHGWDNVVVKVNRAWIFRFRRDRAPGIPATELALLSALVGKTKMPIPTVAAHDLNAEVAYVVYPLLPGVAMPFGLAGNAREAAVADISTFLAEVHGALSWQAAKAIGVPDCVGLDDEVVERGLAIIASADLRELVANAREIESTALEDVGTRRFLHNDVHHRNVAWDERTGRVSGIFDFGDAGVGDFHREFAPLYEIELPLGRDIAAAYEALTGWHVNMERVAAHTVLRIVDDMVATLSGTQSHLHANAHAWLRDIADKHPDLLAVQPENGQLLS